MDVNQRQKNFYDTKKKNLATRVWSYFRNGALQKIRKTIGVEQEIYKLHKTWFSELSQKKVLDLGCFEGNSLSMYLAQNSKEYVAIDLSEKGISVLGNRIKHLPNAKAMAIDFFSGKFREDNFDLIYAYGVLHHFKDTDALIDKLKEKLAPKGEIISYDPLKTSWPIKVARWVYRPFQTDKDWEWPFSKQVFYKYQKEFEIKERRAVLGESKWFFLVNMLPISVEKKTKIGKKWHREDWEKSSVSDRAMFNCMHLSMWMQKRDE